MQYLVCIYFLVLDTLFFILLLLVSMMAGFTYESQGKEVPSFESKGRHFTVAPMSARREISYKVTKYAFLNFLY